MNWYEEQPLHYDILFDVDSDIEGDFLEAAAARHGGSRGRSVLEPGCGSGRLMRELALRGFRVTGFDCSQPMLDFARDRMTQEGFSARLVHAQLESFSFRRKFDLAHCLIDTFRHLPDDRSALQHLQCVAGALKTGGLYALGLNLGVDSSSYCSRQRWQGRRRDIEVTCAILWSPPDPSTRLERGRMRVVARRRGAERRYESSLTFRMYSATQLRRLLRRVPELEHVATYDFRYDVDEPIEFDDECRDTVLILRRR